MMVGKTIIDKLPVPPFMELVIGPVVIALLISLGMVVVSQHLDFTLDPLIPVVLGVIGAAVYAAHTR